MGADWDDVVHGQVAEHTCLNLYFLGIGFPLHLVACFQLFLGHHVHAFEHLHAGVIQVAFKDFRARSLAIKTTLLGFFNPFVRVTVALKVDGLAVLGVFTNHVENSRNLFFTLGDECVYTLLEFYQCFGYGSVEHDHG